MNILMAARNAILNQNNALQDIAKDVGITGTGRTPGTKKEKGSELFFKPTYPALQEIK